MSRAIDKTVTVRRCPIPEGDGGDYTHPDGGGVAPAWSAPERFPNHERAIEEITYPADPVGGAWFVSMMAPIGGGAPMRMHHWCYVQRAGRVTRVPVGTGHRDTIAMWQGESDPRALSQWSLANIVGRDARRPQYALARKLAELLSSVYVSAVDRLELEWSPRLWEPYIPPAVDIDRFQPWHRRTVGLSLPCFEYVGWSYAVTEVVLDLAGWRGPRESAWPKRVARLFADPESCEIPADVFRGRWTRMGRMSACEVIRAAFPWHHMLLALEMTEIEREKEIARRRQEMEALRRAAESRNPVPISARSVLSLTLALNSNTTVQESTRLYRRNDGTVSASPEVRALSGESKGDTRSAADYFLDLTRTR